NLGRGEVARSCDPASLRMVGANVARDRELLIRAAAEIRRRLLVGDLAMARRPGESIVRFDEQPRLGFLANSRANAYEMPPALEARTCQRKCQVSLGEPAVRVAMRYPVAAIPDDHRPAAVFGLGGHPFEFEVLDGM